MFKSAVDQLTHEDREHMLNTLLFGHSYESLSLPIEGAHVTAPAYMNAVQALDEWSAELDRALARRYRT
jgi:hypothetical protein